MRRVVTVVFPVVCGVVGFVIAETHASGVLAVIAGVLLGIALLSAIAAIVVRLGPGSKPDRELEQRAREEFERTGRWDDEE